MDNIIKIFLNTKVSFLIILTIIVFCIYGKSLNYEILEFDDTTLITNNKNLILNICDISNLFLTDCYYGNEASYYRPILNLSFVLEQLIFVHNIKIYHFTNILLFIVSIYLVYLFLLKLKLSKIIIYALCLLLAIHPVLMSCCVWIAARNDTLLLIFTMLSILNLIAYNQKYKFKNLLVATVFFTLSLFTKESSIISLIMFPLFFYVFEYKFSRKQITNIAVCFFFATLIYFVFRNIASIRTRLYRLPLSFKYYIFK